MHPETAIHAPPGTTKLTRPTPSNPRPKDNPPLLTDALTVRNTVFIDEQGCSPEGEIDDDDARSWHWVMYARPSLVGGEGKGGAKQDGEEVGEDEAIGVIRLVPPPHAAHEHHLVISPAHAHTDNPNPVNDKVNKDIPARQYDTIHEPYIKLTRVAVLPAYRGRNLGRKLVETAIDWARRNPGEIEYAYSRVVRGREGLLDRDGHNSGDVKWNGLVLVHAQMSVEGVYARLGFVTDESMGRWDEEGIEHVGMWRRVDVIHS